MTKKDQIHILGPCSLESDEQIRKVINLVSSLGTSYIRMPLFKPRTSPDSFQGMGVQGIPIVKKLGAEYPTLKFVTEVCSERQFDLVKDHVHIIQIGARNMQNFELLKYVGKNFSHEAVLLKRGFSSTFKEWMEATRYLTNAGIAREKVILCERGSRLMSSPTGVVLDFVMALKAKEKGFKVIIDPSHGTKDRKYVLKLAKASLAMDFDGLMIECHPNPETSISDSEQALSLEEVKNFYFSNHS